MDAWIAFLVAAGMAVLFIGLTWWFPTFYTKRFRIPGAEKQAEVEDSYRKTVAQILGGAAIALTFAWTWSKDNQTLDLNRIQTSNQQFSEASTLIANPDVDVRAAGVYSMGNLVLTNSQYQIPVANVMKAVIKTHKPKLGVAGTTPPQVDNDVMAAIYVLGRLPQSGIDMEALYLVGGDFRSAIGFRGATFYSAVLYQTNFANADLSDARFDGAQMSDWESVGTRLWSDKFIADWWASKDWQRVQYVVLFDWASLNNTSFEGTSVAGASFEHADLTGTKFIRTDLSRADFQNARNLEKAVFQDCCYGGAGQPRGLSASVMQRLTTPCKR